MLLLYVDFCQGNAALLPNIMNTVRSCVLSGPSSTSPSGVPVCCSHRVRPGDLYHNTSGRDARSGRGEAACGIQRALLDSFIKKMHQRKDLGALGTVDLWGRTT
ncbi:hypothetical protein JOQ06_017806 [Pogonophryne albipinna]|uniref:Uncharacterized protein n=1 Tax=Pogonophryne albipinna TaxID=1090488 RepID=A0AAD6AH87_9TELE|nr:hypothetical protein JOQ06_017806 [Pogonophryne albipinna]